MSQLTRKHLSQPWFDYIKNGNKVIEGRINNPESFFAKVEIGTSFVFYNNQKELMVKTIRKTTYPTFKEMLEAETLEKVLPGIKTIEDGVQEYYKFEGFQENEKLYGVVALELGL